MTNVKRLLATVVVAFSVSGCTGNRTAAPEPEIPMDYYAGVLRMYPFKDIARETPPKGYKPFMISHYGRHGARFHGDDTQGLKVYAVLDSAHCNGHLTQLGEELYSYIGAFYQLYAGHAAELTEKGRLQHRELAHRMWDAYPEVFKAHPEITAVATLVPRVILSMGAFCDGLKDRDPSLWTVQRSNQTDLIDLAPHQLIPDFKGKERLSWAAAREFGLEHIHTEAFIERIFGDSDYAIPSYPSAVSFMRNVGYLLSNAPCLDVELPVAPAVFSPEELERIWEVDNTVHYQNYGPCPETSFISQMHPLLEHIISQAQEDIASGKPTVRLRFGHDVDIMALLVMLEAEGWTGATGCLHEVKNVWQNWRIPMAANLQFVFFRHPRKEEILLQVLLNEESVTLPIESVTGHFYSWKEFETYYKNLK